MTIQDSQKKLQDADQVGVITSNNNSVSMSVFENRKVLYSNGSVTNVLFNGTTTSKIFHLDVSAVLSSGVTALVQLNTPKLHSPLTMYVKSATSDSTVISKIFKATLIPGASLTFSVQNKSKPSGNNLIVKITQLEAKKPCKNCNELFGVPDKYTKAFIVLMLVTIFVLFIFEFLTHKKEVKV